LCASAQRFGALGLKIGANKGETAMPLKHLALGLAIAAAMQAMFATAQAEEGLYVHSLLIGPVHSPARGFRTPMD
jgi:hypothetical protein